MQTTPKWRKSSYSGRDFNCVECASATWTRSSYSGGHSENCVETAPLAASVAVRDSKHPGAGHLTITSAEWTAFLNAAGHGRL